MMCEYFGWDDVARGMEDAVRAAIRESATTADLGGSLSTRAAGDWLESKVASS
jgi:isocitrate/isopropylmalate dehydrogenase